MFALTQRPIQDPTGSLTSLPNGTPAMRLNLKLYAPGELDDQDTEALWQLLVAADNEFVPSLSSRGDTTTKRLVTDTSSSRDGPRKYFNDTQSQWIIFGLINQRVVGMMSFIPHYNADILGDWSPCSYLSTLIVDKSYRRSGVARRLYGYLIDYSRKIGDVAVGTRTWSTNVGHLALLDDLGFVPAKTIPDHRAPGVDTIYFARPAMTSERSLKSCKASLE